MERGNPATLSGWLRAGAEKQSYEQKAQCGRQMFKDLTLASVSFPAGSSGMD